MAPQQHPLQLAAHLINEAARICPVVLIGASGGKDSNVIFDLLGKQRQKLQLGAFYRYFVKDIAPIERPIRHFCKLYNTPLLTFPSSLLSRALGDSAFRQTTTESFSVIKAREKEIEWAARVTFACHLSGITREKMYEKEIITCPTCEGLGRLPHGDGFCPECVGMKTVTKRTATFDIRKLAVHPAKLWVANGHRQNDSLHRRGMLSSFRLSHDDEGNQGAIGLDVKFRNLYPIAQWSTRDVHSYITFHNLPNPAFLGKGLVSGAGLSTRSLAAIRRLYPAEYEKFIREFPLAEAQILRYEEEEQEQEAAAAARIEAACTKKATTRAANAVKAKTNADERRKNRVEKAGTTKKTRTRT